MKRLENKNSFLITYVACVVLLLLICYFSVNSTSTLKGTSATDCSADAPNYVDGMCCPEEYTSGIVDGMCVNSTYSSRRNGCVMREEIAESELAIETLELYGFVCEKNTLKEPLYNCYLVSDISNCSVPAVNAGDSGSEEVVTYGCYSCGTNAYIWLPGENFCKPVEANSKEECERKNDQCSNFKLNECNGTEVIGGVCAWDWEANFCTNTKNFIDYKATFDGIEEICSSSAGKCSVNCPAAPSKEGYNFVTWVSDSGIVCPAGSSIMINSNTNFTARWNPISSINPPSEDDDGSTNPPSEEDGSTNPPSGEDGSTNTPSEEDGSTNTPSEEDGSTNTPSEEDSSTNPPSKEENNNNDNVIENPKTGEIIIFVLWIIGIAAIGYSVVYFKKLKNE